MKNPQWFTEKVDENPLNESESSTDVQKSNSLAVLKNQLAVLSKLYRNELEMRPSSPVKKRKSTGGSAKKQKSGKAEHSMDDLTHDDSQGEELIN